MNLIKKIKAFFTGPEKEEKPVEKKKVSVVAAPKNVIQADKPKRPKKTRAVNYKLKQKKKRKLQKMSRRGNR